MRRLRTTRHGPLSRFIGCTVSFAGLFVSLAIAQINPTNAGELINGPNSPLDGISRIGSYSTAPGTGVIVLSVFAGRTGVHFDRQAVLKLVDRATQAVIWATTDETGQGVFTDIPISSYDAEVNAVGYLSAQKQVQVVANWMPLQVDMVLQRDPSAVNLDVGDAVMSAKARKEAKHAISALKSGNLKAAQKQLDEAYKSAPTSPALNFLLGYLYFQKKDFAQAGNYLGTATTLDSHNAQALTLLGRTGLERQDYPAARSALEQAVLADAENWLPHNLLADTYLRERNYGGARDEAQIAIVKGKSAASPAQLVLGEALINLGRSQEGIDALTVFLQESPKHPIAGQVRSLIAEIKEQASHPVITENVSQIIPKPADIDPLLALPAPKLSVNAWQPPGVDDIKPALAPGVTCPTEKVIEESGKRMQELVDDVARFAAVEDLFHQSLDEYGTPIRTETRKFNYVAAISEPEPGFLAMDEYRADNLSTVDYPDNIASTGFAALALVFHPHTRDSFAMSCEGLGDWHGQASWLVHFRQRDDRPNRMHSYKVGDTLHPVKLKGRAWITADKFQIVRIEAEMVSPMPEIQLLSEHQVVEYGPVPFASKNTTLWLPKSAEIYFDFRKHRYYRRHSFDHYMLYSVDAKEKRKEPKNPPVSEPATPAPKN
jgi:tetratricopeptide (TPR) repeat protein